MLHKRKKKHCGVLNICRNLIAWGKKLICSLVVLQQILLYFVSDGDRVAGWVFSLSMLWGSVKTSHSTDITDAL